MSYARLRALRRLLISDVDGTVLDGGKAGRACAALGELLDRVQAGLVLATGRDLVLTREAVAELVAAGLPRPEALICSVGSEIYLGEDDVQDESWARHIAEGWDRAAVVSALSAVPGLTPQGEAAQKAFKVSYFLGEERSRRASRGPTGERTAAPPVVQEAGAQSVGQTVSQAIPEAAARALAAAGLRARLIASAGSFLDVLPERASKGAAASWLISPTVSPMRLFTSVPISLSRPFSAEKRCMTPSASPSIAWRAGIDAGSFARSCTELKKFCNPVLRPVSGSASRLSIRVASESSTLNRAWPVVDVRSCSPSIWS